MRAQLVRTLLDLLRYGKYMVFESIRLWKGGVVFGKCVGFLCAIELIMRLGANL